MDVEAEPNIELEETLLAGTGLTGLGFVLELSAGRG